MTRPASHVRAFAPGSVGNIGPGLDILGLALSGAGDTVEASWGGGPGLSISDPGHPELPSDPSRNTAALAAGCFGGLKEPVPQPLVYRIDAPKLAAGAPLAADLKIDIGQVAPGLDSSGIATRWPGQRIDYVAGARWAEALPQLLEAALVEALQDTGRLRSVQGDFGRFRATHTLVVEVRRFEADYTGGGLPVAQVELTATIGKTDRRVVLEIANEFVDRGGAGMRIA